MTAGPVARNEATEFFFDGTSQGQFLLLRCPEGHVNRPQVTSCDVCSASALESFPASGKARLVSWAVVHDRPREGVQPPPPTVPAIVELEEGPWWWTQLVTVDPGQLREGMDLRLGFERPDASEAVPVFQPA